MEGRRELVHMEPFPFAAHDGRLCGSDSRMGLSWVLGAVPEPWVCLPRGSPLQSRVAKGLLKYVSVTCPKQHEIAQISCFQLEENPVKCGRGRRGAEASEVSACSFLLQGQLLQPHTEACVLLAPLSFRIKCHLSAKETKFCFSA